MADAKDIKAEPKAADPKSDKAPGAETAPAAAPAAPAAPAAEAKHPTRVKLAQLYGFWDENKRYRQWVEGDVVENPEEIALLIERQAPVIDESNGQLVPFEKDQKKA